MYSVTEPIKIVFFDIDWTLYVKSEKRIPESISQQVLPRLKEKGIIPAIATGRNFSSFPEALKLLLNKQGFELFITINGQDNLYQNQTISSYPLAVERIKQIIEKLCELGIAYAFVSREQIAVSEKNPLIHHAIEPINANYMIDPHYYLKDDVFQLLAFYAKEREQEVCQSGIFGEDLKSIRWHENAVDILVKANSKAKGIQDVLDYFGFKVENAMAFGDGLNDMEMLFYVGCGVAMGNAEEEVKKIATFVTKDIREEGILYGLEKWGVL